LLASATASSPAPLRVAVFGCGRVFERFHLPALARVPELSLVAACDTDESRLAWARTRLPEVAQVTSPDGLGLLRPDAALILTPPATHRVLVEHALAAGLHVLVEKPMALDTAQARGMADAARSAGRQLRVGFTRRFRPPYRMLRDRVQAARDRVAAISCRLAFPSAAWDARGDFLGVDAAGGGVLDDVLSHLVDLVRWIGGAEPVRARARALADGSITCALVLDSGVPASCWAAHGAYTEYFEVAWRGGGAAAASGVRGYTRPRASGNTVPIRAWIADRSTLTLNRVLGRRGLTALSFEAQLRDFGRAIRGGAAEGAASEDGIAAVAAVEAARASLRHGGGWREIR
jgi:predicted dehydrogenase